jgi:hypothetical protein
MPGYAARSQSKAGLTVGTWPISMLACGVADVCVRRNVWSVAYVEPISKSPEEDNKAGELDKAEEVLSVVLPADEDATLPLYPGEEALDEPASRVTA